MKKNVRIDKLTASMGPPKRLRESTWPVIQGPSESKLTKKEAASHGERRDHILKFRSGTQNRLLQKEIHRPFVFNINEYSRKTTHAKLKCGCSVT